MWRKLLAFLAVAAGLTALTVAAATKWRSDAAGRTSNISVSQVPYQIRYVQYGSAPDYASGNRQLLVAADIVGSRSFRRRTGAIDNLLPPGPLS